MKTQLDAYLNAINHHDPEAALAMLSEDFQLRFTEFDAQIDKSGMVDVLGWDQATHGTVTYDQLQSNANSVTAVFTETNDFYQAIGIDQTQATITFEFNESGLIEKQIYTPLPNQPSVQEKLEPVIAWASENDPEALNEVYPDGQLIFNQKSATQWLALLEQWKSDQGGDQE